MAPHGSGEVSPQLSPQGAPPEAEKALSFPPGFPSAALDAPCPTFHFPAQVLSLSGPSPKPGVSGRSPSWRDRAATFSHPVPAPPPAALAPALPRARAPPRSSSCHSFFFSLQGWKLPGARWPVAGAEPEDGPLRPPPQEMDSICAEPEEGERRGRGAPPRRAPAPAPEEPRAPRPQVALPGTAPRDPGRRRLRGRAGGGGGSRRGTASPRLGCPAPRLLPARLPGRPSSAC